MVVDEETWAALLDPTFCHDPEAADSLAQLLFALKEAIEKGPQGCLRAINTLKYGIEQVYLYTHAHRLARELYESYLTGKLKPKDEPEQLLKEALERFKAESANRGRSKKKSGRSRALGQSQETSFE